MPRKRYEKTGIEPTKENGLWHCGVCGQQKGNTKKDCEQHQGYCLRLKAAKARDEIFGIIPSKKNPEVLCCKYCKHETRKKSNAYRHANTKHRSLIPVGLDRSYVRSGKKSEEHEKCDEDDEDKSDALDITEPDSYEYDYASPANVAEKDTRTGK